MSDIKMMVIDDNGEIAHRPVCNGTYTASEYDDGPGSLTHDEYTHCPACDANPCIKFVSPPTPSHISKVILDFANDNTKLADQSRVAEMLTQAATTIKSLMEEVDYHRLMNANEAWVIWSALGKAMYGHTNHAPSEDTIREAIIGMPQEWAMVQEAIKRLKEQPFGLDDYQHRCGDTADYPEAGTGSNAAITYCVLGLTGEAGEVADKWKKVMRGDHGDGDVSQEVKDMMVKEVGDTTWFAARLSIELGAKLSTVAQGNLDKLESRKRRGVIKGSGDIR